MLLSQEKYANGIQFEEDEARLDATGGAADIGRSWRDLHLLDWIIMSSPHHVIVDGSNLATEGRSVPSLVQLDDAVQAYRLEDPHAQIIVVVDATFGHRIDPSEKATYDEAIDHGELLTPPAGAIGSRGGRSPRRAGAGGEHWWKARSDHWLDLHATFSCAWCKVSPVRWQGETSAWSRQKVDGGPS